MSDKHLTKEADALLCVIYKEYLQRKKNGCSKDGSGTFEGSEWIHANIVPKWTIANIDATMRELGGAGFFDVFFGDDLVYAALLTPKAVTYMENRFADGFASVMEYIGKIKNIIPFA